MGVKVLSLCLFAEHTTFLKLRLLADMLQYSCVSNCLLLEIIMARNYLGEEIHSHLNILAYSFVGRLKFANDKLFNQSWRLTVSAGKPKKRLNYSHQRNRWPFFSILQDVVSLNIIIIYFKWMKFEHLHLWLFDCVYCLYSSVCWPSLNGYHVVDILEFNLKVFLILYNALVKQRKNVTIYFFDFIISGRTWLWSDTDTVHWMSRPISLQQAESLAKCPLML